jgi:hypothetical protein
MNETMHGVPECSHVRLMIADLKAQDGWTENNFKDVILYFVQGVLAKHGEFQGCAAAKYLEYLRQDWTTRWPKEDFIAYTDALFEAICTMAEGSLAREIEDAQGVLEDSEFDEEEENEEKKEEEEEEEEDSKDE